MDIETNDQNSEGNDLDTLMMGLSLNEQAKSSHNNTAAIERIKKYISAEVKKIREENRLKFDDMHKLLDNARTNSLKDLKDNNDDSNSLRSLRKTLDNISGIVTNLVDDLNSCMIPEVQKTKKWALALSNRLDAYWNTRSNNKWLRESEQDGVRLKTELLKDSEPALPTKTSNNTRREGRDTETKDMNLNKPQWYSAKYKDDLKIKSLESLCETNGWYPIFDKSFRSGRNIKGIRVYATKSGSKGSSGSSSLTSELEAIKTPNFHNSTASNHAGISTGPSAARYPSNVGTGARI